MARAVNPDETRCDACGSLRHHSELRRTRAPMDEIPGTFWTSWHCADTPYCRDVIALDDDPDITPLIPGRVLRFPRT